MLSRGEDDMSQDTEEIEALRWHDSLELLSKENEGTDATIEVVSADFGDQEEAARIPLAYVEYDHKDDVVIVGVGGLTARYPVVLRHIIEHPRRIAVTSSVPNALLALDIEAADGSKTLVTLHRRPALPG
jgi:hypothetical protein